MERQSQKAVFRWWQSIMLGPAELKEKHIRPAPTEYKARLRRCATPEAVMLTDGFKALWFSLPDEIIASDDERSLAKSMECWATVAAALVYVRPGTVDGGGKARAGNIAYEAGRKRDGDKSRVSELRFAQLQNARTPEEFLRRLRRILQQLNGAVSPESLICDIANWFAEHNSLRPRKADKRIAIQWAISYYRAAMAKKTAN